MKKIHFFTSAACNYIPKVRMLFNSLREHHPEARLHLLLADERTPLLDLSKEPFDEVCTVADLGIPGWKGWAFCHSIVELATAIKPFYLARLLEREDCERAIYMDPDMVAFSRLDDILAALECANVALTPHLTSPEAEIEGIRDNEISALKHGVYNLGFVGVSPTPEGRRFAAWWANRVYHYCRSEIYNGLFTDQRWIDLVPAFFDEVAVIRSPRHNVATWNLNTRRFDYAPGGGFQVDEEPLGFYHFTGFDSGAHAAMANKYAGRNRAVQELVKWYRDTTTELSKDPLSQVKWRYGSFSNGEPVKREYRFIYRERPDIQAAYPDPFDTSASPNYYEWLQSYGPKEYPALFDASNPARAQQEMVELSKHLSAGYRPPGAPTDGPRPADQIRKGDVLAFPQLERVRRGIEILKTEGYRALLARAQRASKARAAAKAAANR